MLSDPLIVTVDGSSKTLPKVGAGVSPAYPKLVSRSQYRTADGAYAVTTSQHEHRDGKRRVEVTLHKAIVDADTNHFFTGYVNTGVGMVYELAPYGLSSASEIANLRTALLAFVDSTLQGRLINGES